MLYLLNRAKKMAKTQESGGEWAVKLDAGMYAARWGTRAHRQYGGVHFVSDTGEWCKVEAKPRFMSARNARRCVAVLERIGCVGVVAHAADIGQGGAA